MKNKKLQHSDVIEQLYFLDTNFKPPLKLNQIFVPNITFQVTDDCNLCCSYCYQIYKSHHTMPLQIAKDFIDLLILNDKNTKQYIDTSFCKGVTLEFIGGEPFLQITLIDEIITYFRKQVILNNHPWQFNWMINISSNGTLYFNENVQHFIKKYIDHLSLNISLDGNKQLHDSCRKFPNGEGSYDLALKAIHHFKTTFNGLLGGKMTLSPDNIKYTSDAIINLINENYEDIFVNCVFEKGWNFEHAKIFYKELKKIADFILNQNINNIYISLFEEEFFHPKYIDETENWCGGNGHMIAVDWKGDIYPCIRYMESSLGPDIEPIKIGNVNTGIMTDAKCRDCINRLKQVNRLTQSTQECIECPIAEGCAWCQAYNYQDSGDFNHRATYICCMHKARSLANAYFWNSYYRKHNENKRFKIWLPDEEALKIIDADELKMLKELQAPIK